MGVYLPTSSPATSASWGLSDFLNLQLRSDPAAGGRAALDVGQLEPDELWLIDHMVCSCDSTTKTTLRLYASAIDPLRILDGTPAGNFGVADWPAGLQLHPLQSLVASWEGASDGARGVLAVQGRIMRRA
ncbi:MAG: hypothetical protein ACLGI3_16865 [Actinomycetes bacterium]